MTSYEIYILDGRKFALSSGNNPSQQLFATLQSRTGPVQGFPCVVFPHREKPAFITGFPGDENRFFPVRKTTQGKPCFHYRDGFAVYLCLDCF